jgi:2-iminoacetate synthase
MKNIIDEKRIIDCLAGAENASDAVFEAVLKKGSLKKGLSLEEVAVLIGTTEPGSVRRIFETAAEIKNEIYGERLVLFAPLYISDYCVNECRYCNFHRSNETLSRKKLSMEEIAAETKCLIDMGHKRVLVEFGEDPDNIPIDYICGAIKTVYSVKSGNGEIRRINVNLAATSTENYRRLKNLGIGTYQLFQETYHRATYEKLHDGPKADYDRQITAHQRALEGGIDDLGIGVLFGLYDWRFEVMALIAHAKWMDKNLGVGPHTISVPRFQSAPSVTYKPEYPVSDDDFLKLIAILRIAVPYTGMILSTRETAEIRAKAFKLGISQASAASVTVPGGYTEKSSLRGASATKQSRDSQFTIHDTRSLSEVIKAAVADGLIPSFCTACYRKGRTGEAFMGLAKEGEIHTFCRPNALLTFAEYLEDYADGELREAGYKLIDKYLNEISIPRLRNETKSRLKEVHAGKRDLYF